MTGTAANSAKAAKIYKMRPKMKAIGNTVKSWTFRDAGQGQYITLNARE